MSYEFDWGAVWEYRSLIISGFWMTVQLSAVALIFSILIGTGIGTAAALGGKIARGLARVYVETMRNVPLLVHMYLWYMGLAFLKLPPFVCAVCGLTLYSAAYVAEIVRGGIDGVPLGQRMAARASGFTPLQSVALIVYPQAFRMVAPSLASLFSQLIKDSSLASVIAVADLTYQANAVESTTFKTFEIYITVAALYLVLVSLVSSAMTWGPMARRLLTREAARA